MKSAVTCALVSLILSGAPGPSPLHAQAIRAQSEQSVRLCVDMPASVPVYRELSLGILHAVRLAADQWRQRFASDDLRLLPPLLTENAPTRCIRAAGTLASIGPLNSGRAMSSEPILNRAGMLTISPANTNPVLTSPSQRSTFEPATAAHRIPTVTYFRTVTTDLVQGPAAATEMLRAYGARTYGVAFDGLAYSLELSRSMRRYARRTLHMREVLVGHIDATSPATIEQSDDAISDRVVAARPPAVYAVTDDLPQLATLVRMLRHKGYRAPVFAMDQIIFDPAWSKEAGAAAENVYAPEAGLDPSRTATWFQAAFARHFHPPLDVYDGYAYDAAVAAFHAILRAAGAHGLRGSMLRRRVAVSSAARHVSFLGATGTISFDTNGDTTNRTATIYGTRHGRWGVAAVVRNLRDASATQ